MKNKYYNRLRISEAKFREVVKCFSVDIDATKVAEIVCFVIDFLYKITTLTFASYIRFKVCRFFLRLTLNFLIFLFPLTVI